MNEIKLRKLGVGKRMHDDPFFADGNSLCHMYVRQGIVDLDDEQLCHQLVSVPCEVPGCTDIFSSLLEFEMHYNSCHRFICSQCRKPLPSAHLLDLHLSETHDSFFAAQAERKPMYRCFVEECRDVSENVAQRRSHCIDVHHFPHDFRYDRSLKKNKKANQDHQRLLKLKNEDMPVVNTDEKKPAKMNHFTFGHSKQGKTFSKGNKQCKTNQKNESVTTSTGEINVTELMETLPI